MELDPPGVRAEPVCLQTDGALGERDGRRGRADLIAVPLEGLEAARQRGEQRIAAALRHQRDLAPADLRLAGPARRSTAGLGEELRAEADPEQRRVRLEQAREQNF